MTAQYRLLRPHYLRIGWTPPDAIINEGVDVPNGWQPTLAVDPLNTAAVSAFYAAGSSSGARTFVNNSNVVASGNFGAIVAGGGANTVPVYSDGTNWRIG